MFSPQTTYTAGPASYVSSGAPVDIRITAHAALTAGQIVVLPAPSYNTQSGEAYWASTAQTAQAAAANFVMSTRRIFGVVLENASSSALVRIRVRGVANCNMPNSTALNALLRPTDASYDLSATSSNAANHLAVAMAIEANSTGGVAAKACLFDGLYGLAAHGA